MAKVSVPSSLSLSLHTSLSHPSSWAHPPPASFAAAYSGEAIATLASIRTYLPLSIELHDHDRTLSFLRRIDSYLDRKFPMDLVTRAELTRVLYSYLTRSAELHLFLQSRVVQVLTRLVKKRDLPALVLPWRPLYDVLIHTHMDQSSARSFATQGHLRSRDAMLLVQLIGKARRYFPSTTTSEVLALLRPSLCPFDQAYFTSQALLSIFLPTNEPSQVKLWLEEVINMIDWVDNCVDSLLLWFGLLSRAAKATHCTGVIDWTPYLPKLFNKFLQSLNLNVGSGSPINNRSWPAAQWLLPPHQKSEDTVSKYFAKIIIYTLTSSSPTYALLDQLLTTIKTYYHPSSQDRWTSYLAVFLQELAIYYAKRHGRESRGEVRYPAANQLALKDPKLAQLLLPIALDAIYAKSEQMIGAAQRALRAFGFLFPQVVLPPLLTQFVPALTVVDKSHRMMSALTSLALIAHPLFHRTNYPQGAAHLEELLWACLPGLDATDPIKTTSTLAWIISLLHYVPLRDARTVKSKSSNSGYDDMDSSDISEEDARAATFRFDEWSLAFLDKIMKVITSQDKFTKTNVIDASFAYLIKRALNSFFANMSEEIYTIVVKQLLKTITGELHMNAIKHYGFVVGAASMSYPKIFLPLFVTALYKKIVKTTTDGRNVLTTVSKNDIQWAAYMLSWTVKYAGANEALLPYEQQIQTVYTLLMAHDDKTIRVTGGKVMRAYLKSLTEVYPTEYRSVQPSQWNDASWQHWQSWGISPLIPAIESKESKDGKSATYNKESPLSLGIAWHEPSAKEFKLAEKLVLANIAPALTLLETGDINAEVKKASSSSGSSSSGSSETKVNDDSDNPIVRALWQVSLFVRGSINVIGGVDGAEENSVEDDSEYSDESKTFDGSRCPFASVDATRVFPVIHYTSATITNGVSLSLRHYLLKLCHTLATRFAPLAHAAPTSAAAATTTGSASLPVLATPSSTSHGSGASAVKALGALCKIMHLVLSVEGVANESKHGNQKGYNRYLRSLLTEYWSGVHCTARPLLVLKAQNIQLKRQMQISYSGAYTHDVRAVLNDLGRLAVNDFQKVRRRAQSALNNAVIHYPQHIGAFINAMLAVIRSADSSEEQLTGAIGALQGDATMWWLARKWPRYLSFIETLITSGQQHKDDKVQLLLNALFTRAYPFVYSLPLIVPFVPSTSLFDLPAGISSLLPLTGVVIERRNAAIGRFNVSTTTRYHGITSLLLKSLRVGHTLHWRYELMCATWLFQLLRADMDALTPVSGTAADYVTLSDALLYYVRALRSELLPLRRIAIQATTTILGAHVAALRKLKPSPSATQTGGDAKDMIASRYNDVPYSGWVAGTAAIVTQYTQPLSAGSPFWAFEYVPALPFTASSFASTPTQFASLPLPSSSLVAIGDLITKDLEGIINTLIHNHPTLEPATTDSSGGRQGAGEAIASLVYRTKRAHWPYTRFHRSSKDIDVLHMEFVRNVVTSFPSLLTAASDNKDSAIVAQLRRVASNAHDQELQCTGAEIFAGIVRATKHSAPSFTVPLQSTLLSILLPCLTSCQPNCVEHWIDALRLAMHNTDINRLNWLIPHLLTAGLPGIKDIPAATVQPNGITTGAASLADPSPSSVAKRLRWVQAAPIELGWRSSHLTAPILAASLPLLDHPYKQVREEVSRILFFATKAIFTCPLGSAVTSSGDIGGRAALTSFLATASSRFTSLTTLAPLYATLDAPVADNAAAANVDEKKAEAVKAQEKLFVETMMYYTVAAFVSGDVIACQQLFVTLLPHFIVSSHHPDTETAASASFCLSMSSWAAYPLTQVGAIINGVASVSNSSSWHVRAAALRFLQVFVPRHSLIIGQQSLFVNQLIDLTAKLLQDPQIEVRVAAGRTMSSLLTSMTMSSSTWQVAPKAASAFPTIKLADMHDLFAKLADSKLPKAPKGSDAAVAIPAILLAARHAGVLGLAALVQAHPYDLPAYVPAVLTRLSGHVHDPTSIASTVKTVFADFMRTHKDTWHELKPRFTRIQLEAIQSVTFAPSYFA